MAEGFVHELRRQMALATTAAHSAELAGDNMLADAMAMRLADLTDLARRNGLVLA